MKTRWLQITLLTITVFSLTAQPAFASADDGQDLYLHTPDQYLEAGFVHRADRGTVHESQLWMISDGWSVPVLYLAFENTSGNLTRTTRGAFGDYFQRLTGNTRSKSPAQPQTARESKREWLQLVHDTIEARNISSQTDRAIDKGLDNLCTVGSYQTSIEILRHLNKSLSATELADWMRGRSEVLSVCEEERFADNRIKIENSNQSSQMASIGSSNVFSRAWKWIKSWFVSTPVQKSEWLTDNSESSADARRNQLPEISASCSISAADTPTGWATMYQHAARAFYTENYRESTGCFNKIVQSNPNFWAEKAAVSLVRSLLRYESSEIEQDTTFEEAQRIREKRMEDATKYAKEFETRYPENEDIATLVRIIDYRNRNPDFITNRLHDLTKADTDAARIDAAHDLYLAIDRERYELTAIRSAVKEAADNGNAFAAFLQTWRLLPAQDAHSLALQKWKETDNSVWLIPLARQSFALGQVVPQEARNAIQDAEDNNALLTALYYQTRADLAYGNSDISQMSRQLENSNIIENFGRDLQYRFGNLSSELERFKLAQRRSLVGYQPTTSITPVFLREQNDVSDFMLDDKYIRHLNEDMRLADLVSLVESFDENNVYRDNFYGSEFDINILPYIALARAFDSDELYQVRLQGQSFADMEFYKNQRTEYLFNLFHQATNSIDLKEFYAAAILVENPTVSVTYEDRYFSIQRDDEYEPYKDDVGWKHRLTNVGYTTGLSLWCEPEYTGADTNNSKTGIVKIGEALVSYAQSNPNNPVIPEALADYVSITDVMGCSNEGYSKRAFQLLKSNYPDSQAAQETKYWYE